MNLLRVVRMAFHDHHAIIGKFNKQGSALRQQRWGYVETGLGCHLSQIRLG